MTHWKSAKELQWYFILKMDFFKKKWWTMNNSFNHYTERGCLIIQLAKEIGEKYIKQLKAGIV